MGFLGGAGTGASIGGMIGGPIGAGIGAIGGGILGLFGGSKEPEPIDLNVYGMNDQQRGHMADWAFGQMGGIYATDPNNYWGRDTQPGGFSDRYLGNLVLGLGPDGFGGGGGGYGMGGYSPSFASAAMARAYLADASLVDMEDEAMSMTPSARLREDVGGQIGRFTDARTQAIIRKMNDRTIMGMFGSGPAAEWMRQAAEREGLKQGAEALSSWRSEFTTQAGDRRAQGLMTNAQLETGVSQHNSAMETGVSQSNAANATNVSVANAGARNSAAAFGASVRNQQGMLRSEGARYLLGLGLSREQMDHQRYLSLHGMNMDWQRPQAQLSMGQPQQSGVQKFMSGAGAGLNMMGQLGGVFGSSSGGGLGIGGATNSSDYISGYYNTPRGGGYTGFQGGGGVSLASGGLPPISDYGGGGYAGIPRPNYGISVSW